MNLKLVKLFSNDIGPKKSDRLQKYTKILHVMVKANNCFCFHNYVCLFDCGFSTQSRIFHSYGDVILTGEGLQILTYTWLSV